MRGQDDAAINADVDLLHTYPTHLAALNEGEALAVAVGYRSVTGAVYALAMQVQPTNTTLHVNLGNLLPEDRYREAAQPLYQTALDLDPECPGAHRGLARVPIELGATAADTHWFRRSAMTALDCAGVDFALAQDDSVVLLRKTQQWRSSRRIPIGYGTIAAASVMGAVIRMLSRRLQLLLVGAQVNNRYFAREFRSAACNDVGRSGMVDGNQIPIPARCEAGDGKPLVTLHHKGLHSRGLPDNAEKTHLGRPRRTFERCTLRCICRDADATGERQETA